jgi:hypothetical protein
MQGAEIRRALADGGGDQNRARPLARAGGLGAGTSAGI